MAKKIRPKRATEWNCYNGPVAPGIYEVQRDDSRGNFESDEDAARAHFHHVLVDTWPEKNVIAWGPKTEEAVQECAACDQETGVKRCAGQWAPDERRVAERLLKAIMEVLIDPDFEEYEDEDDLKPALRFVREHIPALRSVLVDPGPTEPCPHVADQTGGVTCDCGEPREACAMTHRTSTPTYYATARTPDPMDVAAQTLGIDRAELILGTRDGGDRGQPPAGHPYAQHIGYVAAHRSGPTIPLYRVDAIEADRALRDTSPSGGGAKVAR